MAGGRLLLSDGGMECVTKGKGSAIRPLTPLSLTRKEEVAGAGAAGPPPVGGGGVGSMGMVGVGESVIIKGGERAVVVLRCANWVGSLNVKSDSLLLRIISGDIRST